MVDLLKKRPRTQLLMLAAWSILVSSAALALSGCSTEDDAEFVISDAQRHQDCFSAASPLRPEMFSSRESLDSVGVFMQTDYRLPSTSDLVYLEVYQPDLVRSQLGEPVELADPLELFRDDFEFDEPPVVRGELFFAETCPELKETFGLRGSVVFTELGTDDEDFVEGELIDGEIISLRDEVVVGQISGTWRFVVDQGRPLQYYPTFRDEAPRGPVP
jgi:hypothetical protein